MHPLLKKNLDPPLIKLNQYYNSGLILQKIDNYIFTFFLIKPHVMHGSVGVNICGDKWKVARRTSRIDSNTKVSSTYLIVYLHSLQKLFTNMANSNGASFVPCGIPSFGVTGCE